MARGKTWKKEEDLSLVRALVQTAKETAAMGERRGPAFWARVAAQYVVVLANKDAPPRTAGAAETRWKNIQSAVARFAKYYTTATRVQRSDLQDADYVAVALKMYQDQDPKHDPFEHLDVWEYLRTNVPQHEEILHSTANFWMLQRNKRASTSMYEDEDEAALLSKTNGSSSTSGSSTDKSDTTPRAPTVNGKELPDAGRVVKRGRPALAPKPVERLSAVPSAPKLALPRAQPQSQSQPVVAAPVNESSADVEKAKYHQAMLEASETRNTLLAEQNAIAAEKNMIALFASRDDAVSNEFFDLKRKIALAKLKREFPDFA
uniref:Myb-like domain-containing protein n=1 Tax=Globisporangium ultimum (strain ATCC 200006 / CBS 805.95 / DAOM BR144) TaxID=431595 RepID=K3WAW5_GLOUD